MSQISITTVSTPWADLPTLIPMIAQAGYKGIEIGLKEGAFDPAQPIDPWMNNQGILYEANALEQAAALKPLLEQHHLPVVAIGSYAMTDDIDAAARAIELAKFFGCEFVRVRVPWYETGVHHYRTLLNEARACYRDLAQISAETGIDSLIEIHDNSICPSASAAMRVLEGLDPNHVGVIFDPANYIFEGYENVGMAIDLLGPFLRHVHVKECGLKIGQAAEPAKGLLTDGDHVPCGTGHVDWAYIVDQLTKSGYQGWYSLEDFTVQSGEDIVRNHQWLSNLLSNS